MKLFVTGGTGFIGSHFLKKSIEADHEVIALKRSRHSVPRITLDTQPLWLEKKLEEVSVEDLKGVDAIVHLAAHSANVPYDSLENCIVENVIKPLKFFQIAKSADVENYLVAGSCFEYGLEGANYESIPSNAGLFPTSSYPASKAAASVAFHAFACQEKIKLQILRIFHVFGEGEKETRFWPSLKKAAVSGEDFEMTLGNQVRDFISVEEVAEKFLDALFAKVKTGKPVISNLGTGAPSTLRDFATEQWKRFGGVGKLKFGAKSYRENEAMRFVPKVF